MHGSNFERKKKVRGWRTLAKPILPRQVTPQPSAQQQNSRNYLLICPPEIRNLIYQYVFTFDEEKVSCIVYFPSYTARFAPKLPIDLCACVADYSPGGAKALCEANQLKYVCRQLRNETSCLELRYNSMHFSYWTGDETNYKQFYGYECFAFFYKNCRPEVRQNVKKVEILHRNERIHDPDWQVDFPRTRDIWQDQWIRDSIFEGCDTFRLYDICRERPDLSIILRYNYSAQRPTGWMLLFDTCLTQRLIGRPTSIALEENEVYNIETCGRSIPNSLRQREKLRFVARHLPEDTDRPKNLRFSLKYEMDENWFADESLSFVPGRAEQGPGYFFYPVMLSEDTQGPNKVEMKTRHVQFRRLFEEGI